MSGLFNPTQPLPYTSVPEQPQQPGAPMVPGAPAAPAAPPGAFTQAAQLQQEILRRLQQQGQAIPGMIGAEQGALNEVMKLYGQKPSGPDPALLQLAAGFFAPTKTGSVGESIGTATQGYAGALSRQQEQNFDRATKLAQLKLTQAQLANKLPQMQMENLQAQAGVVGQMTTLEEKRRDFDTKERARAAWNSPQVQEILRGLTPAQRLAVEAQTDPEKRAAELAKFAKGKDLSQNTITKLGETGGAYGTFSNLYSGFSDDYAGAGYGIPGVGAAVGAAQNTLGRGGIGTETMQKQADWWSDYQTQKNLTRNTLFGSALTKTEKDEFDKANIHPGMAPEQVRKNLLRQQEAARAAAAKLARSWATQGYRREAIEEAIGFNLDELGEGKLRSPDEIYKAAGIGADKTSAAPAAPAGPPQIKNVEEWRALPKGTKYIDPNGLLKTKN